jgi:hypothetical protein
MDAEAWSEALLLQVVRVTDDGKMERSCASSGIAGPVPCSSTASDVALRSNRTAMPVLVFEETLNLEGAVDLDGDGDDELIVRQGFCLYKCFAWFEIWSAVRGHTALFPPTQAMNIVAVHDFDGDGIVDVATRAGFAQICHERDRRDPRTKEVRIGDECFGPEKVSPSLVRKNLGGGRFAPPSVEIETEALGRPDPRGFRY